MDIFESLEDLQVSEDCFDEILDIVEEYINELNDETIDSLVNKRRGNLAKAIRKRDEIGKKHGKTFGVARGNLSKEEKTAIKDVQDAEKAWHKTRDAVEKRNKRGLSESCFNDIMDMVEELINELHAPTPASATAVFDRKAQKLQNNTNKFQAYGKYLNTPMEVKPSEFHKAAKQNADYESGLHQEKRNLTAGGQRLRKWAEIQKQKGKLTNNMKDAANNMVHKGQENYKATAGF